MKNERYKPSEDRPNFPKDVTKYTPEKCLEVIEAGRQGKEISQICRDWGIDRKSFYNWLARYPEFKEAWGIGETALLAHKEELTQKISETGVGSAQMHQFYLKNKFSREYRDKQEIGYTDQQGNDVNALDIDKRQLARAVAAMFIETAREEEKTIIDITPEKDEKK